MVNTLIHTPAHTTDHPDRFEDPKAGLGYSVMPDLDAQDPRTDLEVEHAALYAFGAPRIGGDSVLENRTEGNLALDAFARFYDEHDAPAALEMTRRWLRIFHPDEKVQIETQTIRGDSQSDWLDVVCATADGHGTPQSLIDQVRMWAFGKVWTVIPDHGGGICGLYAEGPEEALAHFRREFEDSLFDRTVTLLIRADDDTEADRLAQEAVDAIHAANPVGQSSRIRAALIGSIADLAQNREKPDRAQRRAINPIIDSMLTDAPTAGLAQAIREHLGEIDGRFGNDPVADFGQAAVDEAKSILERLLELCDQTERGTL